MANKREIKKFIRNTCGALAAEMLLARAAFPEIDRKETYEIITDIATLQTSALAKVGVTFDKTPDCLLYTSPSPRDGATSRMPSSA